MRDKLGHKGVVAPGVGFMDAGGDLREVRVLHHHHLVHADQVPLPGAVILHRIDKVRGPSESFWIVADTSGIIFRNEDGKSD